MRGGRRGRERKKGWRRKEEVAESERMRKIGNTILGVINMTCTSSIL